MPHRILLLRASGSNRMLSHLLGDALFSSISRIVEMLAANKIAHFDGKLAVDAKRVFEIGVYQAHSVSHTRS